MLNIIECIFSIGISIINMVKICVENLTYLIIGIRIPFLDYTEEITTSRFVVPCVFFIFKTII